MSLVCHSLYLRTPELLLSRTARKVQGGATGPMEDDYKFEGSVPDYYDTLFGSQLFEPYAKDLLSHLPDTSRISSVLELGCGTGRCTREILTHIGGDLKLTATDISQEMLDFAKKAVENTLVTTNATIKWQIVDECDLPYEDNSYDLVVCQFGYMFGTDKEKAISESVRVLRPGGLLLFNVWDDIEKNPLCYIADKVLKETHPDDHDEFFQLPYSMHDRKVVKGILSRVGLINTLVMDESIVCYWNSPMEAASAIIDGSPISLILRDRGEDEQPILQALSAAYQAQGQNAERQFISASDDISRVGFTMNAIIFISYKPI